MYHHHERRLDDAGDWSDVADEIEVGLVVERRIDGVCLIDQEQGVAVRCCPCDCLSRNVASSSWSVFNHKGLREALGQPLADQPRDDVGPASGRVADSQTYHSLWISTGPCNRQRPRQRGDDT